MEIEVSHGAYSGSFGRFRKLRRCVAQAAGGDLTDVDGLIWAEGAGPHPHPGLHALLARLGITGCMGPQQCEQAAREIGALLPRIEAMGWTDADHGSAGGQAAKEVGSDPDERVRIVDLARQFAAACQRAADAGQALGRMAPTNLDANAP